MTSKFNAKNLHYEKPSEPAFLQQLRRRAVGDGDKDLNDVQHVRPAGTKKRLAMDDDDDGPTIVYEGEGQVGDGLGRSEYEALTKARLGEGHSVEEEGEGLGGQQGGEVVGGRNVGVAEREGKGDGGREWETQKRKVTDVGGVKKRKKVGKVVAGDENDEHDDEKDDGDEAPRTERGAVALTVATAKPEVKSKGKPGKKQKKVKLSFDEPDS